MHLTTTIPFLLLISIISAKLNPPEFDDQSELKEYLSKTYIGPPEKCNTVGITGMTRDYTTFIGNWFISTVLKDHTVVIGSYGYDHDGFDVTKTKFIFSFVNDVTRINTVLNNIRHYSFYQESAYVQFLIGKPYYGDLDWLEDTIWKIWTESFINFVLVFNHDNRISVIGYNPFTNTMLNYSKSSWQEMLFSNKFNNLYGYTINVALYPDYPRNILDDDKPFRGEDVNTLTAMAKHFNITFNIIICENHKVVFELLRNYSADVAMNKYFVKSNEENVTYSYPILMDDVIICTPKGKEIPFYLYMFFTFDEFLWSGLFIAFTIVILISTFIKVIYGAKIIVAIIKSTNFVFRILFAVPISAKEWLNITTSARILFMYWLFFSLIICISFTSSFMKMLVVNRYEVDIKTLREFYNSQLDVYTLQYIQENLQKDPVIGNRIVISLRSDIVKMIEDRDISHAYAMPNSLIKHLVKEKNVNGRLIYNKLTEILMPGYSVYVFQYKSPFIEMFDDFLIRNKEYGLSSYRMGVLADGERLSENRNLYQPLEIHHIEGALMILSCGYYISIIVLLIEILVKKGKLHFFLEFKEKLLVIYNAIQNNKK